MSHYPYSMSSTASQKSGWFFSRLFRERVRLIKCSITFSTACSGFSCFKGITSLRRERILATESAGRISTSKVSNKTGSRSYVYAHWYFVRFINQEARTVKAKWCCFAQYFWACNSSHPSSDLARNWHVQWSTVDISTSLSVTVLYPQRLGSRA